MGGQSRQNQSQSGGAQQRYDYEAIIARGDVDKLVEAAERIGEEIAQVNTAQIRGIFASVRLIQLNWSTNEMQAYRDAKLLVPRIGYSAARNKLRGLDRVLIDALGYVKGSTDERRARYANFVDFMEAIVAYHKMKNVRN
jgi:CRISPR type III-A-associated protein Csm2